MTPEMHWTEQRDVLTRARLAEKLTPTQYRRMALFFGLGGKPPLSERQAARAEGVTRRSIRDSRQAAWTRLERDAVLLLLWLTVGDE